VPKKVIMNRRKSVVMKHRIMILVCDLVIML